MDLKSSTILNLENYTELTPLRNKIPWFKAHFSNLLIIITETFFYCGHSILNLEILQILFSFYFPHK